MYHEGMHNVSVCVQSELEWQAVNMQEQRLSQSATFFKGLLQSLIELEVIRLRGIALGTLAACCSQS